MKISTIDKLYPEPQDGESPVQVYVSPTAILHKKQAATATYTVDVYAKKGGEYVNGIGVWGGTCPSGMTGFKIVSSSSDKMQLRWTVGADDEPSGEITFNVSADGKDYGVRIPVKTVADGGTGPTGKIGPIAFLAGAYDSTKSYTRTDELVPVVYNGGSYYYPKENGTLKGSEPSATNTAWSMAQNFDIVIAKMVMATFGQIGSAIFSGDFMFSQRGRTYNKSIKGYTYDYDYTKFDPEKYKTGNENVWKPMFCLNFLTGALRAINLYSEGGQFDNAEVNGTLTANLFYSKTKEIKFSTSLTEYKIDPDSDPATTFFVNEPPTLVRCFIRLPESSDYDGMEITIFVKHTVTTRASAVESRIYVGCKSTTDKLYVRENNAIALGINATKFQDATQGVCVENTLAGYKDFTGTTVNILFNNLVRFKAIGGAWYAIEGIFLGE